MMKKGFSTIEVIVSLLALCIILMPILNLSSKIVFDRILDEYQNEEYNIAVSICEMFKSEALIEPDLQVVFFINSFSDLNDSVSSMLNNGLPIASDDTSVIENHNSLSKKYAIVLKTYSSDNIKFLRVTVVGMKKPVNRLILRVGT